jgi:hypothetical protein
MDKNKKLLIDFIECDNNINGKINKDIDKNIDEEINLSNNEHKFEIYNLLLNVNKIDNELQEEIANGINANDNGMEKYEDGKGNETDNYDDDNTIVDYFNDENLKELYVTVSQKMPELIKDECFKKAINPKSNNFTQKLLDNGHTIEEAQVMTTIGYLFIMSKLFTQKID